MVRFESDSDNNDFEIRKMQQIFGPQIPADWTAPKFSKWQPQLFSKVDNPRDSDKYYYHPKFQTKGQKNMCIIPYQLEQF